MWSFSLRPFPFLSWRVLFPFLPVLGQLAELSAVGIQAAENAKAKDDITVLEYALIIERFLDENIEI